SNTFVSMINGIEKSRLNTLSESFFLSDSFDSDILIILYWSSVMFTVFCWIASIGCVINVSVVCACFECDVCACRNGSGVRCGIDWLNNSGVCDDVMVVAWDDLVIIIELGCDTCDRIIGCPHV